jgi:hypothetical protein
MATTRPDRYRHAEAFALMTYQADDGSERATVFNSRDGVTPFVVTLPSGKVASHVNWQADRAAPDHQPRPGDLVFIDLTPERARARAAANYDRFAADPDMAVHLRRLGATREQAEARLAATYLVPGAPDMITWPAP